MIKNHYKEITILINKVRFILNGIKKIIDSTDSKFDVELIIELEEVENSLQELITKINLEIISKSNVNKQQGRVKKN